MSTNTTQHVSDAVRNRILTGWTSTSVSWEGFNAGGFSPTADEAWIRPSVQTGGAGWVGIGGTRARARTAGVVIVEVFVPVAAGVATGLPLCDALIDLFDQWSSGGLRFREKAYAREIGRVEGGWWKWNVYAPWHRDQIAAPSEVADMAQNAKAITQAAHGLAVKDWIGISAGTWSKVAANGTHPRCDGVVAQVIDADHFVIVLLGALELAGHGYTSGAVLYLHQSTAGTATATAPTSGISQRLAIVADAHNLIVHPLEQVSL